MEKLFPSGTLSGMRGSLYPLSQIQHLCSLRAMCQNFGLLLKMNPRNGCGWSYQLGGDPGGLLGRLGHTIPCPLTLAWRKLESAPSPTPAVGHSGWTGLCGAALLQWGWHLLSWPFLVPIPTQREWLLLMGGISSPNETSSCEHVLA